MNLENLDHRELCCLYRALLEYEKVLSFSAIANNEVVAPELHRTLQLQEKVSLLTYCAPASEAIDNVQ